MLSVASRAIRTTEPNRPATVSESVTRLCPDSIPSHPGGRVIRPTGTSIPQTRGPATGGRRASIPHQRTGPSAKPESAITGPEQGHPAGPRRATAGPAASIRPARGTGGPPSQGRQPVRHTGETFVRPGRPPPPDEHPGTGHPPYGENIRQAGANNRRTRASIQSQSVGDHRLGCRSAGLRAQSVLPVLGCHPPGRRGCWCNSRLAESWRCGLVT